MPGPVIAGKIDANGTILSSTPGISVNRRGNGIYEITIPARPTIHYPIITGLSVVGGNDDIAITYMSLSTSVFEIYTRRQDNGGAAGVLVNNAFSFFIPIY